MQKNELIPEVTVIDDKKEKINTNNVDNIEPIEESINDNEPIELTDEEKREIYIKELKASKMRFKPVKHIGNVTVNNYGTKFKKERKRKNKQVKKSRRTNRK